MPYEIQIAESELVHGFVDAVSGAFFIRKNIVLDGFDRIAARQVQIAYRIVNLVEIVFVAVVACHSPQGFDFG